MEGPRITRKGDTHSQVAPPPSKIMAGEKQCAPMQLEGWGTDLSDHTARGTWPLPESKLHINYVELKAVLLALTELQDLYHNNIVLIATDNTTVVALG